MSRRSGRAAPRPVRGGERGDKKDGRTDDGRQARARARESARGGRGEPRRGRRRRRRAKSLGGFPATTGRGTGAWKGDAPGPGSPPRRSRRRPARRTGARRTAAATRARGRSRRPPRPRAAGRRRRRVDSRRGECVVARPGDGEGSTRGDVRVKKRGRADRGHRVGDFVPIGKPRRLSSEAGDAPSGLPRSKSRLALSSNSASRG